MGGSSKTMHGSLFVRQKRTVRTLSQPKFSPDMKAKELLETAGLKVPFEDGSIKGIAQQMTDWLEAHQV